MPIERGDRWKNSNETEGDFTVYRFDEYTLKMQYLMGQELSNDGYLVPIVEGIHAELVTPEGDSISCDNHSEFVQKMKELELPLYLDSRPLAAAA